LASPSEAFEMCTAFALKVIERRGLRKYWNPTPNCGVKFHTLASVPGPSFARLRNGEPKAGYLWFVHRTPPAPWTQGAIRCVPAKFQRKIIGVRVMPVNVPPTV